MTSRIYLDHASTTPILPAAAAAMAEACRAWANPSSPHAEGRAVRAQLEDARRRVAAALGWGGTLIFTSGATESNNLAIKGVAEFYKEKGNHIITSTIGLSWPRSMAVASRIG